MVKFVAADKHCTTGHRKEKAVKQTKSRYKAQKLLMSFFGEHPRHTAYVLRSFKSQLSLSKKHNSKSTK